MPEQFLHGVEVIQIDTGTRPIRTVKSSVIGLVGTAPKANPKTFPLNTPVLIAGKRGDAAGLGQSGTLPPAIDDIFDQAGAIIVMIRVAEGKTEAATLASRGLRPGASCSNPARFRTGRRSARPFARIRDPGSDAAAIIPRGMEIAFLAAKGGKKNVGGGRNTAVFGALAARLATRMMKARGQGDIGGDIGG